MRAAFVVQRYGEEIIGGAEAHAKMITEKLAMTLNWDVEVVTTTASSYATWASTYPTGKDNNTALTVLRFRPLFRRYQLVFGAYNRLVAPILKRFARRPILGKLLAPLEYLWYALQGPYCPAIPRYLRKNLHRYDAVFFFTYLYYPTAIGIRAAGNKAILIPTAHDELPFYFATTRRLLNTTQRNFLNTDAERDLVERVYPETKLRNLTVGIGLAPWSSAATAKLVGDNAFALPHKDYILYLGRVSTGKGVNFLIHYFLEYLLPRPNCQTILVIAGQIDDCVIPEHPQIRFVGKVSDEQKFQLIAGSLGLINPSPKESMSLVVLEAFSLGVPVIANGSCEIFRFYAQQLPSLRVYNSPAIFMELLDLLRERSFADPEALSFGQAWVEAHFSWSKVIAEYAAAASQVSAPGTSDQFKPASCAAISGDRQIL